MSLRQIRARIKRLLELSDRLGKEIWFQEESLKKCTSKFYFVESREYLAALHDAVRALERARITLVNVKHRLEDADKANK